MRHNSKSAFNSLFRFRNLLLTPKQEWTRVAHEDIAIKDLILNYAFPIIIFCSIIESVGVGIHKENTGIGIIQFFVAFLSLNLGLLAASKIIELLAPNFQFRIKKESIFKLIIYSGSIFCLFHGIAKLFTPYSFLNQVCLLLELYFIRVLWLGTGTLLPIADNKRPGFSIIAGLLVLVLPLIFERMFSILFKLPITI